MIESFAGNSKLLSTWNCDIRLPVTVVFVSGSIILPKYPVAERAITLPATIVSEATLKVSAFIESLSPLSISEPPRVSVVSSHDTIPIQAASIQAAMNFLLI